MIICNRGHAEIVFTQPGCPMCEMINDYDAKVRRMANAIETLDDERNAAVATINAIIDADLEKNKDRYEQTKGTK